MATDYWTDGTANWDTLGDWSAGLPGPSSDVVINSGNPEVTASFGTVNSIRDRSALTLVDAGASSVTGRVRVASHGTLSLDALEASGEGGSSLTIGGRLTNSGLLQIGNDSLSAASTVEAARIVNFDPATNSRYGTIDLTGSTTAQATLDVGSAAGFGAAGVLYGDVSLSGDALTEFKGGQIASIAANSVLSLSGSQAFVADASDTRSNSALAGLDFIDDGGALVLDDGASAVTTSSFFTLFPGSRIALDEGSGDGGSSLTFGATLTNLGLFQIGPRDNTLSAPSTVRAPSVVNTGNTHGSIQLYGSSTAEAALDIAARGLRRCRLCHRRCQSFRRRADPIHIRPDQHHFRQLRPEFERLPRIRCRRVGHEFEQRA